jgi:glyoxylate/hydroxypyruvate reductase A
MHDPYQAAMMSECAAMAVLWFHRGMHDFQRAQQSASWKQPQVVYTPDFAVGILGLGDIGRDIAAKLRVFGFQIHGWTRTPRNIEAVTCHHGLDGLATMLPLCQYVVNVLPSTTATRGLLDAQRLASMLHGAFLVNLGRGVHVVDDDLLAALDSGQIGGAFLDVFAKEPLPSDHPYWRHSKVIMTPHMAGELLPRTAAKAVVAGIRRHMAGGGLSHVYDLSRGY